MSNGVLSFPISLGTIQLGRYDSAGVPPPFNSTKSVAPLLDCLQAHGHKHIDTARIYGYGGAEELLSETGAQQRGLVVSTKLFPTKSIPLGPHNTPYAFDAQDLSAGLQASLDALKSDKVETFFLYAPDSTVPLETTLRALDDLHKQGRFERWGLCNFPAWIVAKIQELCIANGWVRPAVYQAIYNALSRTPEAELLPCIRSYGMSLEAAQPLASGMLTGRYRRDMADSEHPRGGRFDPSHFIGQHLRHRYWHGAIFDALQMIQAAADEHGLSMRECALRWLVHHSALKSGLGDRLVVGASSAQQLDEVLEDVTMRPLPEEVVKAINASWLTAKAAT